jgi:4-amino-4-deoxy-L-arabinose transferase-like glycosyltransferase
VTDRQQLLPWLILVLVGAAIYLGCIISPPSLMDDVDAVQAEISRVMLVRGDYVTPRVDGIPFLEKPPLVYWAMAGSFKIFGVHDWAARIPIALSAIAVCLLTASFGAWAFGRQAGFYAGLGIITSVGLFLFTRILIPDVILMFFCALAMWSYLRAVDEEEPQPRVWAFLLAVSLAAGLLLKSLIGVVFPVGAALIHMALTGRLFDRRAWRRLHPFTGVLVVLLIAAPWHILATIRNPPYFAFTWHSGPNNYHGFLWFFVINEQLLRFLNLRYPHDYNTVPRLYFWLFQLIWLFPWSVYLPAVAKLSYRPFDRAGRTRLLCLCWLGFVLVFFTFSTTQEYYSMPCYPAFALLLGSAMQEGGKWIERGTVVLRVMAGACAVTALAIFLAVRKMPTPGDISNSLAYHPKVYSLSLGHMLDLRFGSFAYLKVPLLLAAAAFLVGALGTLRARAERTFLVIAIMMVLFFHAARLAMITFDPFLSSRVIAEKILSLPPGQLILNRHFWPYSSVGFYTDRPTLLANGRAMNLEYGSHAPGAPDVFLDYAEFRKLWNGPERCYFVASMREYPPFEALMDPSRRNIVLESGEKLLLTNFPLSRPQP